MTGFTLPAHGPGGEPIDWWRTIRSHGVAGLPPNAVDDAARTLTTTLPVPGGAPRTVVVDAPAGTVRVLGRRPAGASVATLEASVRHLLRADADLSGFYALVAEDPDLAWATAGAGRMVRSPTVFEEVVKTICTTNCAWSATVRMVGALVAHLGAPAADGSGRAFPTPAAMADAGAAFYAEVVRAGYRGPRLHALATQVAEGVLDLEDLAVPAGAGGPDDDAVEVRLLVLPGVGPYAAAHVMHLLGRHSRLILDSWTRPTYARLVGRTAVSDTAIRRRFARYGPWRGLAFWLLLTRGWVSDQP